jgi:hypothetical protein
MSNTPRHTTPFRRPASVWSSEAQHDPADMGTEYGLEMRLARVDEVTGGQGASSAIQSPPSSDV